jgi:hypothetical protein
MKYLSNLIFIIYEHFYKLKIPINSRLIEITSVKFKNQNLNRFIIKGEK